MRRGSSFFSGSRFVPDCQNHKKARSIPQNAQRDPMSSKQLHKGRVTHNLYVLSMKIMIMHTNERWFILHRRFLWFSDKLWNHEMQHNVLSLATKNYSVALTRGVSCLAKTTTLRRASGENVAPRNELLALLLPCAAPPNGGSPATVWTQLLLNMVEAAIFTVVLHYSWERIHGPGWWIAQQKNPKLSRFFTETQSQCNARYISKKRCEIQKLTDDVSRSSAPRKAGRHVDVSTQQQVTPSSPSDIRNSSWVSSHHWTSSHMNATHDYMPRQKIINTSTHF